MKHLYFLIVLLTGFIGFAFPPPTINNPTPLTVCDPNADGFEPFDLTTKIPEILGSLNPALYSVTFHETMTDAELGGTVIPTPTNYISITPSPSTVYVRVQDVSDGTYSLTSLALLINPAPQINSVNDVVVPSDAQGNHPAFDLLDTYPDIFPNGQAGLSAGFFNSQLDALNNMNPIDSMFVFAYGGVDGELVWVRVQNQASGCFVVSSFHLRITQSDEVYIPDNNFRNKLLAANAENTIAQDLNSNPTIVDTNSDGRIQYSEAAAINALNVASSEIRYLDGLEAFINLVSLDTSYNPQLRTINTSTLPLFQSLGASSCALTSLNFSNNPLLFNLVINSNQLPSLDLSPCPLLFYVSCQNNQLATLNLTGLTVLDELLAQNNHLTVVNTADLDSINYMNIASNSLTSIDISGLDSLEQLIVDENNIDSLNATGCTNLTNLRCAANEMTFLEVSQSPNLNNLDCSNNTLLNLDLGSNSTLCSLNTSLNDTLVSMNIKNGIDSCYTSFNINNPGLQFLCCDDNEINYFKNYFIQNQNEDINVNSYCSFTPGGNYNTITANIQYDANNNGCDVNDGGFPNARINISDGTNQGATFTNSNGGGLFYAQAGNFTISPSVDNPTWFSVSPASAVIPFSTTDNNTANQNFCVTPVGVHPDLEVVFAPLSSARPGFDARYSITVRNKGNQIMSFTNGLRLQYEAEKMQFLSASQQPSIEEIGSLSWDIDTLYPFDSRNITVNMNINTPAEGVNNGDVLSFTASLSQQSDEIPADNTFQLNQTVVGSFDPNEIVCLEGNIVSPIEIGNYLHYTINFENTGTADAENVVVRDTINPAQFDVSSLQLLGSSASVTTRIVGNTAEFIFPSINLHSGGHGNILLKVRTNTTLNEGDSVSKTANIYFDYNFPVATEPENTVFQSLSNPDVPIDVSISVYPNPTKGTINIDSKNNIKSVSLYDVQGRLLQTNLVNKNQTNIDISDKSNGVYFLKIISDNGMKVQKIVRE